MRKFVVLAIVLLIASAAFAQMPQPVEKVWKVDLTCKSSTTTGALHVFLRSDSASGPFIPITAAPVAQCAYSDTNVQRGKTYYYVSQASLNGELSVPSNVASAKVPDPLAPDQDVTATPVPAE